MAADLETLREWLREDGVPCLLDPDGERLIARAEGLHGRWRVEIRLSEAGECLHLRCPAVAQIAGSPHAALLCERILELHYQIKLGRFGLDPRDGEIDCEVILPLDGAELSPRQFRRCFTALVLLTDQHAPRWRGILADGRDPAREEAAQTAELIAHLAATLGLTREQLEAFLADEEPPAGR